MKYTVIDLETEEVNMFKTLNEIMEMYDLTAYETWWLLDKRYLTKIKLFQRMKQLTEKYSIFTNRNSRDIDDYLLLLDDEEEEEIKSIESTKTKSVKEHIKDIEGKLNK
jgi:hypothetical protein